MHKILLIFLLLVLLKLSFSQEQPGMKLIELRKAWSATDKLYREAEQLTTRAGNDEILLGKADKKYTEAMTAMTALEPLARETHSDSLLFLLYSRRGFIHNYFDSSSAAKRDYLAAIAMSSTLPNLPDSVLFFPYLYIGGIYYSENEFDSSLFYYKKAETVNDRNKTELKGSERLCNRLGVMYYEMGNYRKARNYFDKAIMLTEPSDQNLLVNYKINIASILVKLQDFEEAKALYDNILSYNLFTDEIYHNLAIIGIEQHDNKNAINYLRKVNYADHKKNIDLFYNFSVAFARVAENDSSELYMQKALTENLRWNGHRKNTRYGLMLKFQGDELLKHNQFNEATSRYQQAIIQFDTDFEDTGISQNPQQFSGVYSYINLFNTLAAKADALEKQYEEETKINLLQSSLAAYRSAFQLADYVENTYDSDEARLFLEKVKYLVHSRPIHTSLRLYELTGQQNYLEEAYLFDQKNKASLLIHAVRENERSKQITDDDTLARIESELKTTITRLSLKASNTADSTQMRELKTVIRDSEISLAKIREKINDDPRNSKSSFTQIPGIHDLQKKLDNSTAVLSYHLSENELLILLVTSNLFEYKSIPINTSFITGIENFKNKLQLSSPGQRYSGQDLGMTLYKQLIAPVISKLSQVKRLVIIPDDELHYLPFEALQDENKKFLIERFSVQYQYATALLGQTERKKWPPGILSFAPFVSNGHTNIPGIALSRLPASGEEIAGLAGASFTDSAGTKEHFLRTVNHFGIVHLATHATVNNTEPSRSFISFYPGNNENRLYAQEIYDLVLDSTRLVILSACETGTGKLIKGEGLISLSRAFAYAGCPNIITSLWKCEDRSTAFITKRLHFYLDKKYSPDMALQQAKIDFFNSSEIDPALKSPNYWAHLVFIGDYEKRQNATNWWWVAVAIIGGALTYKLVKRKT